MITILSAAAIAEINFMITGYEAEEAARNRISACNSSYFYYVDPKMQAASIIFSLVKDHFFRDGNKRTAFICYMILSRINGLPYLRGSQKQAEVFEQLASSCKTIADCSAKIFPV